MDYRAEDAESAGAVFGNVGNVTVQEINWCYKLRKDNGRTWDYIQYLKSFVLQ